MNCSQLQERRTTTNWERATLPHADASEHRESPQADAGSWRAVRSLSMGQFFAPWVAPPLKTSSN